MTHDDSPKPNNTIKNPYLLSLLKHSESLIERSRQINEKDQFKREILNSLETQSNDLFLQTGDLINKDKSKEIL